ncbi:MAG: J domain-containing protein [Deltaproteobacteria bacterium]|nr:J domain-containing protein [Deltaproteobacteria bacterium]
MAPLPDEPGEIDELRPVVDSLYAGLDSLPYHDFLGVGPEADGDELRQAFHLYAQVLHPDRYYFLEDEELKAKIYAVYKRITEAYRVLGDPESRRRYEEQRARGAVRLDPTDHARSPRRPEDTITVPAAKKYYSLGVDAERRGDARTAKLNFQLALQLEPASEVLKEKMEKYR